MTRNEFIKALESGRKDFRKQNLSGLTLTWADLEEAKLTGANLEGAKQ